MISPLEAESKRTNRKLKLLIEVSTGYEVNLDGIQAELGIPDRTETPGPDRDSWTVLGLLDRTGIPGLYWDSWVGQGLLDRTGTSLPDWDSCPGLKLPVGVQSDTRNGFDTKN